MDDKTRKEKADKIRAKMDHYMRRISYLERKLERLQNRCKHTPKEISPGLAMQKCSTCSKIIMTGE